MRLAGQYWGGKVFEARIPVPQGILDSFSLVMVYSLDLNKGVVMALFKLLLLSTFSLVMLFSMSFASADKPCTEGRQPEIRIVLAHYGSDVSESELDRVWDLLRVRFLEATGCQIRLTRVANVISPLKTEGSMEEIPSGLRKTFGGKSNPADLTEGERRRLARLRYYYFPNGVDLISNEIKRIVSRIPRSKYDAIVALSAAQFDGLGYGAVNLRAVTEQPVEIAWEASHGGRTVFESDSRTVDELIHELGHYMGLLHAANHCSQFAVDAKKFQACCKASPNGNDIMSYCRRRGKVSDNFFYKFEACNQEKIRTTIVPKLLKHQRFESEKNSCK